MAYRVRASSERPAPGGMRTGRRSADFRPSCGPYLRYRAAYARWHAPACSCRASVAREALGLCRSRLRSLPDGRQAPGDVTRPGAFIFFVYQMVPSALCADEVAAGVAVAALVVGATCAAGCSELRGAGAVFFVGADSLGVVVAAGRGCAIHAFG